MLKNLSIMLKIIHLAVDYHDKKAIINVVIQCTILSFCCEHSISDHDAFECASET